MGGRAVEVPEAVRQKALARGAEGRQWLDGLGGLIHDLEHAWGITVGPAISGGSESYVATGMRSGTNVVVKLEMPPYASFPGEIRTLTAADGHGYVRLLAHDEERHAMLQEQLGLSLHESGLPSSTQIEILCATLRRAWNVQAPAGLPSAADKARWLSGFIAATWEELDRPCSGRVVDRALAFADARGAAFDPEAAVLVHGDVHNANALQDPSHPKRFKLVDPDGLLAEPAYDLAIPMREWSGELLEGDAVQLGRQRCTHLGRLTGVEPRAIWEWGFIERVSTGLLATQVGAGRMGKDMLDVAEAWATHK